MKILVARQPPLVHQTCLCTVLLKGDDVEEDGGVFFIPLFTRCV